MSLSFSSEPVNYRDKSNFETISINLLTPYQVHSGNLTLKNQGTAEAYFIIAEQGNTGNSHNPVITQSPYSLSVNGEPVPDGKGIKLAPGETISFKCKSGDLKPIKATAVIVDLPATVEITDFASVLWHPNAGALAYRPFG